MTARTPYEYPLAAHAADADAVLSRDQLAEELAREASAWLEAADAIEESRSARCATRLQTYLRQTRATVTTWDGPA